MSIIGNPYHLPKKYNRKPNIFKRIYKSLVKFLTYVEPEYKEEK